MELFEKKIAELLEVDSVDESEVLEDFGAWDSLTSLSIIAAIDEAYSVTLSAQDLIGAKTIGGLKALVLSKYKKYNEL